MSGTRDAAQAAQLRAELWFHVAQLSERLEQAERQLPRQSDWRHRQSRRMRAELYKTHRLIDALNLRFPPADSPSDRDYDSPPRHGIAGWI